MRNRYLHAFKESYNVVGLTSIAALSAALLNPVPLVVGLVLEAAYLAFVPDLKWYAARLSKVYDLDVQKRRDDLKQKVLPSLPIQLRDRFNHLEEVRQNLTTQNPDTQSWFPEVLRKLDFLLDKFLQFAAKEVQFSSYLNGVREDVLREKQGAPPTDWAGAVGFDNNVPRPAPPVRRNRGLAPHATDRSTEQQDIPEVAMRIVTEVQAHYDGQLAELKKLLAAEQDESTRAVLEKRCDVLQRRREFVGKIGRIQANLGHQLKLLEETFGLISDEMLARPPEQVLADIEDVVSQTNTMTQVLEEVAPYEQMLSRIGGGPGHVAA